jgi:ABC-2 type transport system permease protein
VIFRDTVHDLGQLALIYHQQLKTAMAIELQYRVAMLIWLIGIVLEPLVYLVVWRTVAQAGGGAVGGFNTADFAAYFIVSMVVNHLTFTWHMWEYDYNIRQGLLSPRLLLPLHPIHADVAQNLSYKLVSLVVVIPTCAILVLIFKPAISLSPPALVAFVPALLMAFLIQFLLGWALAMAAFWTTRISAVNEIYFLGKLFLAGQMAPLALLSPSLQTIATISPFRWMLSFPVELFLGRIPAAEVGWDLLAQAVWVVLSLAAAGFFWRQGIRRYAAFGA